MFVAFFLVHSLKHVHWQVELTEAKRLVTTREGGVHDRLKKAQEEIVQAKHEVITLGLGC